MRELTVISGKGGTGKTSVVASFAALATDAVIADCDVETPDLHLVLAPQRERASEFVGQTVAALRWDLCLGCGRCADLCRYDAISALGPPNRFTERSYVINARACEGCNLCAAICPSQAITMMPAVSGEWYVSSTAYGPLVHARLRPGHGNSGKLVTLLRQEARTLAAEQGRELIICDGVPGIGCAVIASLTGVDLALVVVEPSISGRHDFERVVKLADHFSIPVLACVNKFDIDPELSAKIESRGRAANVEFVGRIPSDPAVVAAQMRGVSVVEHSDGPAAAAIRSIWHCVQSHLERNLDKSTIARK